MEVCGTGLNNLHWIFITLTCIWTQPPFGVTAETLELCPGEDFEASCREEEIIMVTSAEYGRREIGRCLKKDKFIGCYTDILPLLDRWCSGRQQCDFSVPNPEIEQMNQDCLEYLKMYVKVTYHCMPVRSRCSTGPTNLNSEEGFLASHMTKSTRCGTSRSPWNIIVSPGKTINITLFDFRGDVPSPGQSYSKCKDVYGFILERSLGINHTICGGTVRKMALYSSKTNNVEVHLKSRTDSEFLLKYSALGCGELSRPANAWYKREGNEAVIGCETNDQEWRLTCTGNTWQGTVGNCSTPVIALVQEQRKEEMPVSSLVIITSIVGGAVVVIVAAIMCGIIHMKKYRMKQERKRLEMQMNYATVGRRSTAPRHVTGPKEGNLISMEPQLPMTTQNSVLQNEPIWKTPLPDPHETDTSLLNQNIRVNHPDEINTASWTNGPSGFNETSTLCSSTMGTKYCPLDN